MSFTTLDALAIDLFGKKIPKKIHYQVLNSEFKNHSPLTLNQSKTLLAIESCIQGIPEKKILKRLGVSIINKTPQEKHTFIQPLFVNEVVLTDTTSESSIAGIMEFTDKTGRSVKFWFDLKLKPKAKKTEVTILSLNLMMNANPQVELFLVPEDAIDTPILYAVENYSDLYSKISSIAINKYNPAPIGMHEYIAIAFHKELIAPNINIKMKISTQQDGVLGNEDESRYKLIKNSWLVTILPFYSDLSSNKKWIKITAQSSPNIYSKELTEERLIGSFLANPHIN
ncbi:MAG: hypothetical protein AB8B89_06115 [Gammaproteobacteria bacterium]